MGKPKQTAQGFKLRTVAGKSCKPKGVDTEFGPVDGTADIWCGVDNWRHLSPSKSNRGYDLQMGTGDDRCLTANDIRLKNSYESWFHAKNTTLLIASGCRNNEYTGGSNTKFDNKGLHGDPGCPLPTSPQNWRLDTGKVEMLDSYGAKKSGCPPELRNNGNDCPKFASSWCGTGDNDGILKCTYKPVTSG